MQTSFEFLTEGTQLLTDVLVQVLHEHGIPSRSVPVYGAGLRMYTGAQEQMKVYVPANLLEQARELLILLNTPADEN